MPEWDFFFAHRKEWIASDRVRDEIRNSRFSGITFQKVTCS